MSAEVKTRALLLQSYPFRERSRVLRLHTEAEGTLSALLLGAKGSTWPIGALLTVRLRIRPQRELQRVAEIDWDYPYQRFYNDPLRYPYLLLAVEWLSRCLGAPDAPLFAWVREQLIALDQKENIAQGLQIFLAALLTRLGGAPPKEPLTWPSLEAAYRVIFPDWQPLRAFSLLTTLSLPTYEP